MTQSQSSLLACEPAEETSTAGQAVQRIVSPSHNATGSARNEGGVDAAWTSICPPAFPSPHQYQSCFCEENVYLLIQDLSSRLFLTNDTPRNNDADKNADFAFVWDVRAIFITNPEKTTLLFQQKASKMKESGSPVVWDYHVVAAVSCTLVSAVGVPCRTQTWIYDADSLLAGEGSGSSHALRPIPIHTYVHATFSPTSLKSGQIPHHYWPVFRIVPARDFLETFASDRSHMKSVHSDTAVESHTWHSPPPLWPLIRGEHAQSAHNLMSSYVDVSPAAQRDPCFGTVCDHETFFRLDWSLRPDKPGATLSGNHIAQLARSRSLPSADSEAQRTGEFPARVGGRVSSHLFPAYLHAAQQDRAHTPNPIASPPL